MKEEGLVETIIREMEEDDFELLPDSTFQKKLRKDNKEITIKVSKDSDDKRSSTRKFFDYIFTEPIVKFHYISILIIIVILNSSIWNILDRHSEEIKVLQEEIVILKNENILLK